MTSRGRRRCPGHPLLAGLLLLFPAGSLEAQDAFLAGRVLDAESRAPVVGARVMLGIRAEGITDSTGAFKLGPMPTGRTVLTVEHVAYGRSGRLIDLDAEGVHGVQVLLSPEAIALEPLVVEGTSFVEFRRRARGSSENIVTRAQIEATLGGTLNFGQLLQQHIAGLRVRRVNSLVGSPICIELRASTSGPGRCNSPAVYVDGVPIQNPTQLFESLDPEMLESVEVIPASEAGARYGSGALYGAMLIETRRPGLARIGDELAAPTAQPEFDWAEEASSHAWARVLGASFAANAAGALAGSLAARQCIELEGTFRDRVDSRCALLPTLAVAGAALGLPALAGGLASRSAGRTTRSEGALTASLIGAGMTLLPGYALILSSRGDHDGAQYRLGVTLIGIGTPVVMTFADRLFRRLR